jgi:PAS domain S-box-containing protein/putative nucleotidyltransferase with HDIG domain
MAKERRTGLSWAGWLALGYAVPGFLWIFLSDRLLLALYEHPATKTYFQTLKGIVFVSASAAVLYAAVSLMLRSVGKKEAEVRAGEKFLQDVFDSLRDGVSVVDRDLTIMRANPVMERWFADRMPLAGKKCYEVYAEGPDEKCPAKQTLSTGKEAHATMRVRVASGSERLMSMFSYPLISSGTGGIIGVLEYLKDVTEQERAEEARRISDAKYRAVFNAAGDAMLIIGADGVITEANRMAAGLLGMEPGELVGAHFSGLYPEQDAFRANDILAAAFESGKTPALNQYLRKKDGSPVPVEISAAGAQIDGRRMVLAVIRDMAGQKEAEERTARQLEMLGALYSGAQNLAESLDLMELSRYVAYSCVENFGAVFAWLGRAEPDGRLRHLASHPAEAFAELESDRWDCPGPCLEGKAVRSGMPAVSNDLLAEKGASAPVDAAVRKGLRSGASFPLVSRERTFGALTIYSDMPGFFTRDRVSFFQAYAHQAAATLENARLHEETRKKAIELALAYETTLEGWSKALDLRDRETEGHTLRVTGMTLELARRMGMSEQSLVHVRRGALLHDIGKMAVPDSILLKPGPLSEAENEVMKKHPVHAFELLSPIEFLRPALPIPHLHHERWDGLGYPMGLKGEQIALEARIFAVVDVWDALTVSRPYREAMATGDAAKYLKDEAGRQFDPNVVERFLDMMAASTKI